MRSRSALVLTAAALGLGFAVFPAQATPYAGQFRYLSSGSIVVQGADGARWMLGVGATEGGSVESRSEQSLFIDLSRCSGSSCTTVGKWVRPLSAAEVSISSDCTSGRVHTVLAGLPLDVALTGNQGLVPGACEGAAFDSVSISETPVGVGPSVSEYSPSRGTVALRGLRCPATQAEIGVVTGFDTVGDDVRDPRTAPPAKLPAGFLAGRRAAHC